MQDAFYFNLIMTISVKNIYVSTLAYIMVIGACSFHDEKPLHT